MSATLDRLMGAPERLSDWVREMIPKLRSGLSPAESALAPHIRGNEPLYTALTGLIRSRIEGRRRLPVPTDPMMCKSILDRNNELEWLLSRLEAVYNSPANTVADKQGEQPAA